MHRHPQAFSHEVLFYAGPEEYVERVGAFVREGASAGEPVLVMVPARKVEMLRDGLGADAAAVTFADMGEEGRNPGRIISAWNDFATEHVAGGGPLRGVGEPIWAGRSPDELVECQHHEALINVAFGDADGFRLLCPYDTDALSADVIEEAYRSHPLVLAGEAPEPCAHFHDRHFPGPASDPLPAPRVSSLEMGFQESNLPLLRQFVARAAEDAGLAAGRVADLVLAVGEAAANSIRHAGGAGVVRAWNDGGAFVCEVRDRGRIGEPLVGRLRPADSTAGGYGLWLANQLCDLVQVRSRRSGTVVRLHMRLA